MQDHPDGVEADHLAVSVSPDKRPRHAPEGIFGWRRRRQYANRRIDTFMTSPNAAMIVNTLDPP